MSDNRPRDGLYRMRNVPIVDPDFGMGGMYATGEGPHRPIRAAPEMPPFIERQNWHVRFNGKGYVINFVELGGSENTGFSYEGLVGPDRPVVLGNPKEWILQPVNTAPNVYIIRATDNLIGVDVCVGVSEDNNLVFKFFRPDEPFENRPAWQFFALPME